MSNVTKYTRDAFKSLSLLEDVDFELTDKDSFQKLDTFINDDGDIPVETEVIDLDAENEEELKDSYVGDGILSCTVCHTNMFKTIEDVVIDEETGLCCVGEECPVCGNTDGFKILGKVAPFEEEEVEEAEVETEPDEAEVEIKEKVRESFKKKSAKKALKEKIAKRNNKRRLTEEVSSIAYDMAEEIDKRFAGEKFISWDDFNEAFEDAYPGLIDPTDAKFDDLETDVRGILGYLGWETIFEGEDEGGLRLVESKSRTSKRLTEDKGDLNKLDQDIQDIVGEYFGYTMDFDFLDIVGDVLLRVDDFEEVAKDAWETVDSTLIYDDDQWNVLRHYVDSVADLGDGSWDDAFAQFVGDIEEICGKVAAQRGGEEISESKKLKGNKKLSEEVSDYAKEDIKREIERIVDEYFKGTDFFVSVSNIDFDAGKVTLDISALGGYDEDSDEVEELNREVEFDIPNLDLEDYFAAQLEDWMNTHNSPDNFYESKELTEAPTLDSYEKGDFKAHYGKSEDPKYKEEPYWSNLNLFDKKGEVIGSFGFNRFEDEESAKKDFEKKKKVIDRSLGKTQLAKESKQITEAPVITRDVTDQVIVKRGEPGFISKMHDLRAQGYEMSWSGNGQMVFTKPKELVKTDPETGEIIEGKQAISNSALKKFRSKKLTEKKKEVCPDCGKEICECDKTKAEELTEDIEKATIETENEVINLSSKEKDMNADFDVADESDKAREEEEMFGLGEFSEDAEEVVAPLSDDDVAEIEANSEEGEEAEEEEEEETFPEDEEEFEFDEVQEESFNRLGEQYLKKVYSNVDTFKFNNVSTDNNKLVLEGVITFKSGKTKKTSFVFERVENKNSIAKSKARYVGLNETFTDKKNAYVLNVKKNGKTLVAESLRYNYPAKTKNLNEEVKVVKGLVK